MTTVLRRAAALAALLAAVAAPRPAAAQPTVTLPAKDRVLAGAPTPLFSIGREDGRSWEMLNEVSQVAFGPRDELYVLDRGNERVLVFDARGRFVRQVGKEGSGPGELRVPVGMALLPGDTLAVADLGNRNFSLFGPDGAFARSVAFPGEARMPSLGLAAHPAGGVVSAFRTLPAGREASGTFRLAGPVVTRLPLRPGAEGVPLYPFPGASTVSQDVQRPSAGSVQMTRRIAGPPTFSPLDLFAVLPDGQLAVAHENAYAVKVLDAAGRPLRTLRRPLAVRLATPRDRERERQALRERLASGRGRIVVSFGGGAAPPPPRESVEEQVRQMAFADTIAPVRGLRASASGTLWIQRTGEEWSGDGPIDLVTPSGRYAGTLLGQKLPAAISTSGRAAYVERDELDVERVVVKQLPAAWR